MKRKLIKRYMLLSLPFICGLLLYGIGSYGIVSSLLFFLGGYILIKNIFDYRVVIKNIKKCNNVDNGIGVDLERCDNYVLEQKFDKNMDVKLSKIDNSKNKYGYDYIKRDNINGLKSNVIHKKIRKRY